LPAGPADVLLRFFERDAGRDCTGRMVHHAELRNAAPRQTHDVIHVDDLSVEYVGRQRRYADSPRCEQAPRLAAEDLPPIFPQVYPELESPEFL